MFCANWQVFPLKRDGDSDKTSWLSSSLNCIHVKAVSFSDAFPYWYVVQTVRISVEPFHTVCVPLSSYMRWRSSPFRYPVEYVNKVLLTSYLYISQGDNSSNKISRNWQFITPSVRLILTHVHALSPNIQISSHGLMIFLLQINFSSVDTPKGIMGRALVIRKQLLSEPTQVIH